MPSRPREFHPEPLTDPDVILSHHPARAIARRLPPSAEIAGSSRFDPVGPRSTTMTHPLRSMGITPLRRYYEAVRPSPAHQYFQPHGWSRLRLYGLSVVKRFFVRPGNPVSSPRPAVLQSRARAGAVKVGRDTNLSTSFGLARPYLDSSEHGGTLDAIGITIRGEPAFRARKSIAPHPCIRWGSRDPRTMMQFKIVSTKGCSFPLNTWPLGLTGFESERRTKSMLVAREPSECAALSSMCGSKGAMTPSDWSRIIRMGLGMR